jgi:hypothetical protein
LAELVQFTLQSITTAPQRRSPVVSPNSTDGDGIFRLTNILDLFGEAKSVYGAIQLAMQVRNQCV